MDTIYFQNTISCMICLFILLNPFLLFLQAHPQSPPLGFLKSLTRTRNGNTTKGISQLKKYLSNLGYMSFKVSPIQVHDDLFDNNLELAIKLYQKFFKLDVTGILDEKTINKLGQTRCGVPDFFKLGDIQMQDGVPILNASHYTYFPGKPVWPLHEKSTLTFSFAPNTKIDLSEAFVYVMKRWTTASTFKFEYTSNYNKADIKISFQYRDHHDGSPFDGPLGILAHAAPPTNGNLHFDGDENWVFGVIPNAFDLQTVGLHEMGHILGLGHSNRGDAIMYPYIGSGKRKDVNEDDVYGIMALYHL